MLHPFLDNVTENILHIFRLHFFLFCNLYKVERLTIIYEDSRKFAIGRKCNTCITYKAFRCQNSEETEKKQQNPYIYIRLPLCSNYGIRASSFILTYQVSNIIDIKMTYSFLTNYSDFTFNAI